MASVILRSRLLTLALAVTLLLTNTLLASNGKLLGTVTDKSTGDVIEGASIKLVGTTWGAKTSVTGDFVIVNIPPGLYDVEVTHVSFNSQKITGVQLSSDVTTKQNFELDPSTVKIVVKTITYKKPPVKLDVTQKQTTVDKEKLEHLKVADITDVLKSAQGFRQDPEGRWHVRGSREGGVAFIVEGQDRRDALVSTGTNYSISSESVDEVNILTGGFTAEYTGAGAIVAVTTPEGKSERYTGSFQAATDRFIKTYSFDTDRMELDLGGPVPGTKQLLGSPITFYLTTIGGLTNTYTPFNVNRPNSDYFGIGVKLPERQDNSYQTSLKLAYNLTDAKKLTLFLSGSYHKWDIYPNGEGGISGKYGYGYKYNIDKRPYALNRQYSGSLTYTDQLSNKTFYSVSLMSYSTQSAVRPREKDPGQFTMLDAIENDYANAYDRNLNGRLEPDEYLDKDGNGYMDGYWDANGDFLYEGGGEGYEDLNMNGQWDRGEDWVDLNGNGVYDAAEPWVDVVNPLTGENTIGFYDSWDNYTDLNGNGRWDAAEPQLPEQDWNHNGRWDGERFQDANTNGHFDGMNWEDKNGNGICESNELKAGETVRKDGEGYDDKNLNGSNDKRDLMASNATDRAEPFIDGDWSWDTGEPFIDEPDPISGLYNGIHDANEVWIDLPGFGGLNGKYDGPRGYTLGLNHYPRPFELFTRPANSTEIQKDPSHPVIYTWEAQKRGSDWPQGFDSTGNNLYTYYIPGKSTWINRTQNDDPKVTGDSTKMIFDYPNGRYDQGTEWYSDYNGNGEWNSADYFLNPDLWDPNAYWYDRTSQEYTLKANIQSQVNKYHELKGGFEVKYRDLQMQSIQQPDLPYTGEAELPSDSPWRDRGGVRDFYQYRPTEGGAYVQDKMEFEGLILNGGLRVDFIIHDKKAIDEFRQRLLRDEPGAIVAQRGTYRVSPRLGISHPITEQSKLYFNYGHFYQAPSFQYFYKSATANFSANSTIGNPNLEYEKTIQYELGVNTQISEYFVVDLSGYYKDQYDLISTADERWKNLTLDRYVNLDYGRMRGFELSIEKRPSNHYALNFNYDFSFAFGKASDQHANQQSRLNNVPYNYDEHPLGWDETHKINANLTVLYNKGDHPRLFGLTWPDNWMLTAQWEFGSGLPYTPSTYTTGIDNANLILPNSARMPWHEYTTLKFEKYYQIRDRGDAKLVYGFTINNLFNKRNVQSVYTSTGSATQAVHPLDKAYNPNDNRLEYDADPLNYGPGRQVILRVGVNF